MPERELLDAHGPNAAPRQAAERRAACGAQSDDGDLRSEHLRRFRGASEPAATIAPRFTEIYLLRKAC